MVRAQCRRRRVTRKSRLRRTSFHLCLRSISQYRTAAVWKGCSIQKQWTKATRNASSEFESALAARIASRWDHEPFLIRGDASIPLRVDQFAPGCLRLKNCIICVLCMYRNIDTLHQENKRTCVLRANPIFNTPPVILALPMSPSKYKVAKSYPQGSFRRILKKKTTFRLADDNTDMVVYLIYMDYLRTLMAEATGSGLTERGIEQAHELVLKRFRG